MTRNWKQTVTERMKVHSQHLQQRFCPSLLVRRQQGRECRGAAGQLPVGSRALQQTDPTGRQQEPAGHHLHPGVSVSAHQRGEYLHTEAWISQAHALTCISQTVGLPWPLRSSFQPVKCASACIVTWTRHIQFNPVQPRPIIQTLKNESLFTCRLCGTNSQIDQYWKMQLPRSRVFKFQQKLQFWAGILIS